VSARAGALSFREVRKVYDPGGDEVVAIEALSLEIAAGEFVAIVGPSGCGKTTLLNAIAGFDRITAGEIRLDDRVIASGKSLAPPGADRVVVFQSNALFPWKTVLENVAFGPLVQRREAPAAVRARARERLERAGLGDTAGDYPRRLSSGVQRRIEFVRALMNDPKVLLLDEPFRALDAMSKAVMHEHLLELFENAGTTVFFITHDLDEAILLADRVIISTSRPMSVKSILTVDLPRPRDYRVVAGAAFAALKAQALAAVGEEAEKAFALGERELAS
jgi:NitT/TauT family transport system ATP-binding protein